MIDNLQKGAAGQAVQCFNLSKGFEESLGLIQLGLYFTSLYFFWFHVVIQILILSQVLNNLNLVMKNYLICVN